MYVTGRYYVRALSEIGSLAVGFECFSSLGGDDVDHAPAVPSAVTGISPTTVLGVAIR